MPRIAHSQADERMDGALSSVKLRLVGLAQLLAVRVQHEGAVAAAEDVKQSETRVVTRSV